MPAAEPIRTCIGCRQSAPRVVLLRLNRDPVTGLVGVDEGKSAPGRGAHLHDDPACFLLAIRRRALGRAFRQTGEVGPAPELVARFEARPTDG